VVGQGQGIADNRCTNLDGAEYVAYVFAHDDSDESMIKCGTYDGIPQPANPEVDLGWEPQWVMIKRVDGTGNWTVVDSMRGITDGPMDQGCNPLRLNTSETEFPFDVITLTSTGFIVNASNADFNSGANGAKYIYMAIRRPNKPAEEFEPDELFAIANPQDKDPDPSFVSGFPVDMGLYTRPTATYNNIVIPRLTDTALQTESTDAEWNADAGFDYMNGYISQDWQTYTPDLVSWMWRRAPGFFDVVAWEGNGVNGREIPHGLGVEPEMLWIKPRSGGSYQWSVWHKDIASSAPYYEIVLNKDEAQTDANNTNTPFAGVPTSTSFPLLSATAGNRSGWTYIAYLFASVPGISKVGSYTGDGQLRVIDCGFDDSGQSTIGLLVKRTDANGDWAWHYTWTSGAYLAGRLHLNEASAGAKQNDLDAGFGGFRLQPTSPYNIDGAKYIYYAIAE
jgi:hypothetical protein